MKTYDDTFKSRFFMQLGGHFMHPHMFSSSIDVGCGVVDAGLDDLSAVLTKGLLIVSDTSFLAIYSLVFRGGLLRSCSGISK